MRELVIDPENASAKQRLAEIESRIAELRAIANACKQSRSCEASVD